MIQTVGGLKHPSPCIISHNLFGSGIWNSYAQGFWWYVLWGCSHQVLLAPKHSYGAGYWQEASVLPLVNSSIGCLNVLTAWLQTSPQGTIQEKEQGESHSTFSDVGLEVTPYYFHYILFFWKRGNNFGPHSRGEELGSTFWGENCQIKFWCIIKSWESPWKFTYYPGGLSY